MKNTSSVDIMQKISSKEFSNYFYRNILPLVLKFEKSRNALYIVNTTTGLAWAILAACYILLPMAKNSENDLWVLVQILAICLTVVKIIMPKIKTLQQQMKFEILPLLLNFICSNDTFSVVDYGVKTYTGHPFRDNLKEVFSFKLGPGLDYEPAYADEFRETSLFSNFNLITIDDVIMGNYNSLPILLRDIDLKYQTGSGKNRRVEQVFRGLIIKFPMNKNFNNNILVKRDELKVFDCGNRVHLEDPIFEKYFDVYSDDQIEARYILTTGFMNRLVKIAAKNKKYTVSCCFMDGNMYLALGGKDWFDIPGGKSFKEIGNWQRVLVDFVDIFRIIDELKIEQNIGM